MKVKTIKLSETKGLLYKMAKAMIEYHGVYRVLINGEKVNVIKD